MHNEAITDNAKIVWLLDIGRVTMASKGRGKVDYLELKRFLEKKYNLPCSPFYSKVLTVDTELRLG
jgi:hypothetical protein